MKNIIKKGLILFLFNLLALTPVLSQTTLDSIQSKTLCLILNEHEKLSIENPLLKRQIISLNNLNQLYIESDSIQKEEIKNFKERIDLYNKEVQKLKKSKKNIIFGSSFCGIFLFIIGLII